MSESSADEANEERRLMTRIDGEAARLLVHIEPIDDGDDRATDTDGPAHAPPRDSSGLAE
jgi:hypothetical protein